MYLYWYGSFFLIIRGSHERGVILKGVVIQNTIAKMIWSRSTFNKEPRATLDVTRKYRVLKFVKLGVKTVKLKLLGSIQQIITTFFEFLLSKVFLRVLERIFPLNDISELALEKTVHIYKTSPPYFFKTSNLRLILVIYQKS